VLGAGRSVWFTAGDDAVNLDTLIRRSLRFHARSHLGVVLGAAVGSAALVGALVVGDSVRGSLRDLALQRLGHIHYAMDTGDRLFREELVRSINVFVPSIFHAYWTRSNSSLAQGSITNRFEQIFGTGGGIARLVTSPVTNYTLRVMAGLKLAATASARDGAAHAHHVQLLGISEGWPVLDASKTYPRLSAGEVILNEPLAAQLGVADGDQVLVRARKPQALAADSPIAPQDESAFAMRLRVRSIAPAALLGNFNLTGSQTPPLNAFVRFDELQRLSGAQGRANLLVSDPPGYRWLRPLRLRWYHKVARSRWYQRVVASIGLSGRWRFPLMIDGGGVELEGVDSDRLIDQTLKAALVADDFQLDYRHHSGRPGGELRTSRVFLDPPVVEAVFSAATNSPYWKPTFLSPPYGVLTYLVNLIRAGDHTTPYSMVTAAQPPLVPADLRDDEIILSQWLADDLQAGPGAEIELTYYLPDQAARLAVATNRFRVRAVLPMDHPALDRDLMPDFPGIAKAESTGDWETSFPLTHKIRPKDDAYWKQYRGTPKAFITLAAGQRMWSSRFGNLTAIRLDAPFNLETLFSGNAARLRGAEVFDPASLGFRWQPVRAQALAAASEAQDFGGLFLGFSFFLIAAALILMALLFQFSLEQRAAETGTLLALGFTPGRVRLLLLGEGLALALAGGTLGVFAGLGYAWLMMRGLATLWRDAVAGSALAFHVTLPTLAIGLAASVAVCVLTMWLVLRRQARRPARELLAGEGAEDGRIQNGNFKMQSRGMWIIIGCAGAAVALVGWALLGGESASPPLFFGAGSLLLIAGLAAVSEWLSRLAMRESTDSPSLGALGWRGAARRRTRSLASVALLACGSFMIVAVGANRLDAGRDATKRSSGTGGFAFFGQSALPVVQDLNTQRGREFFGLDEARMTNVSVVPLRVRDGDEASCLNLNRAQNPRLLGVNPSMLAERGAFTFAKVAKGYDKAKGWGLLRSDGLGRSGSIASPSIIDSTIPAIGDAASIQWALKKNVGDTLDYTDERGRPFKVRLVAGVANSILQGNLLIDEEAFKQLFPGESGHRMFLIDAPSNPPSAAAEVSAMLTRALQDYGLELTPAARRLAAFHAVQNTYLNTFQVLGGLGLLLGSTGLGVVVLRNVLERRAELGLLRAVGFRCRAIQWLVLAEHGGLLWLGLGVGLVSALAAVLPALLAPGAGVHYRALGATLLGVFVSGLLWTWLATRLALRGGLLKALRNE
jgi:ABC-type lipoprotein release transport system permease subunit